MKLFIDEDAGLTLAKALKDTGFAEDVDWVASDRLITPGTRDRDWIPQIGPSGRIIISANIRMAQNALESRLLVENKAR